MLIIRDRLIRNCQFMMHIYKCGNRQKLENSIIYIFPFRVLEMCVRDASSSRCDRNYEKVDFYFYFILKKVITSCISNAFPSVNIRFGGCDLLRSMPYANFIIFTRGFDVFMMQYHPTVNQHSNFKSYG